VTITLTNTAPTANNASYSVTKGVGKAITLTAVDANGDPLTYSVVQPPTKGNLSCSGANCTYVATSTTGGDSFTFVASDGQGGTSTPGTITIGIGYPKISLGDAQVLEPDSGNIGVYVPITLASPLATDVTIAYYTVDGTATGAVTGGDYRQFGTPSVPRTIKIPAGQTWNAIAPLVNADATTEPDETFQVRIASITAADGSNIPIGDASATVTIIDNYRASSDPLMVVQNAQIYEGDNADGLNKAQFVIQFSKPLTSSFTLSYRTVPGTATEGPKGVGGMDYRGITSGVYTVPAGITVAKTIDIPIWGDTVAEGNETFQLIVTLPDGAQVIQKQSVGTITLLNDD
jgi:chitinase